MTKFAVADMRRKIAGGATLAELATDLDRSLGYTRQLIKAAGLTPPVIVVPRLLPSAPELIAALIDGRKPDDIAKVHGVTPSAVHAALNHRSLRYRGGEIVIDTSIGRSKPAKRLERATATLRAAREILEGRAA